MIESILQRFAQGEDLTKEDLCTLLRVPVGSRDYYNLLAEANGYSRKAFEGKGLLFGQIGLDIQPCRINCKFCSLAADFLKGCTPFIRDLDDTVQLAKQLADAGVRNYSIYWDKDTNILFGYQEIEGETSSQDMGADEVTRRWWDYMADLMEVNPDNSPVTVSLREVFHLD